MEQREFINKAIKPELDKETKDVSILYDGNQFLIKFPKVFSNHWKLKKGEKINLSMLLPEKGSLRKSKITLELVDK